jgi:hypothetical protein
LFNPSSFHKLFEEEGVNMHRLIGVSLIVCCAGLFIGCEQKAETVVDPVAHGKYLVNLGGCNDCHTPKVMGPQGEPLPDTTRVLAGHAADEPYPTWSPADMQRNAIALTNPSLTAWAGPWGVSFGINLTPDTETGIGEWTEEAFISTLRTGKHQGQPNGRAILPPMPWQSLAMVTDGDLKAIWAYLRTLPPVKNQVPLPVPPSAPPAAGQ